MEEAVDVCINNYRAPEKGGSVLGSVLGALST